MKVKSNKQRWYAFMLISATILIIIISEAAVISTFHSSESYEYINANSLNGTAFIIITKLPDVSMNAEIYIYPNSNTNISYQIPENDSYATVTPSNFGSTHFIPDFRVSFNATSSNNQTVSVSSFLDNNNVSLTPDNPVSIIFVNEGQGSTLKPSILVGSSYDCMILQVSSVLAMYYGEVSR